MYVCVLGVNNQSFTITPDQAFVTASPNGQMADRDDRKRCAMAKFENMKSQIKKL